MTYQKTQTSSLAVLVSIVFLAIYLVVFLAASDETALLIVVFAFLIFIEAIVIMFNRLTVTVGEGVVSAAFGWGWPKRTIELREVTAFRQVRNRWWYGWGLRKIPRGWMYNVWGLDAVELDLNTGKKFRIGTDEPGDLLAALTLHTSMSPSP